MRALFFGSPAAAPATRPGAGRSLLRKLALFPKGPATLQPVAELPPELAEGFGMVIRDPFYEWDRHELHPRATNYEFLTEMASNLYSLGVRWVRIEFHAEPGGSYGAMDYRKYDWFINVAAPRFGLKVLALFNTGIVKGAGSEITAFQATGAADPHNAYIKVFADRAVEIATRYGPNLHAYEILNEPNKYPALAVETQGQQDEIDPLAVGTLMCEVFPRLKAVQNVPVLLGGLLTGTNRESKRDARGYLTAIYESPPVAAYRQGQSRWPFDAVGLHPYHDGDNAANTPDEALSKLDAVYAVMQAHGDAGTIWVTEIGMEAGPPPGGDAPSAGEIRQANFLNGVYAGALTTRRAFVERLFWFKYEDIWVGRDETWGVVRLAAGNTHDLDPSGAIVRRRPAYDVYSGLTPAPQPLAISGPSAPTNLGVVARLGGEVRFSWEAAVPGTHCIKQHQLFRASRPDMSGALHVASVEHSLDLSGRAPRGTSYYALRAVDSAVPPNLSPFSNVVKVSRLL